CWKLEHPHTDKRHQLGFVELAQIDHQHTTKQKFGKVSKRAKTGKYVLRDGNLELNEKLVRFSWTKKWLDNYLSSKVDLELMQIGKSCRKDVDDVWLGWFITSDKDWISMPTCSKNDVSGAGYTLR